MIIEKNIKQYIVFSEDSILNALRKISDNKSRVVFSVTESGAIEGILTDGDFRRWLVDQSEINLNKAVSEISNKSFIYAKEKQTTQEIQTLFSNKIEYVPILDDYGHLTAIGRARAKGINISGHIISDESPCFIIAEIGNNHNGSLDVAKHLIELAAESGSDCAKFQLRDLPSLYRNAGNANDASEDLGSQYTLDLLTKYQLTPDQMFEAFNHCERMGIIPLCTPWDKASVNILEQYGIEAYKIASADLTNLDLLEVLSKVGKPLICSTGMSREPEIKQSVEFLKRHGAPYALLHCNSTYPTPFKDVNLKYMARLKDIGDCVVGYSGHERGYHIPLAAVSMGAKIVEKHLTIDRTMEGNDHKISLLPSEFKHMVRSIREIEDSLGNNVMRQLTQGELMNRETLAKSLIVTHDLKQGEIITADAIDIKCPGQGLQPNRKAEIIGLPARRDLNAGDLLFESDLRDTTAKPRHYHFSRPWGIPVRYHDYRKMLDLIKPDFLEFHFSYKDLEVNLDDYFSEPLNIGLVVHSPELFAGDHVLDLCADDDNYRRRSIEELCRVVEMTRNLTRYFPAYNRPCIVTNIGGFTMDRPMAPELKEKMYARCVESIAEIDLSGVEIIPQTMPPFPWHFGGQRYHNLFVDPNEIVRFCRNNDFRVCLDVSHSKLACNHHGFSFQELIKKIGPYTAHLHMGDADGVDGEGLQIGDGDIDFRALMKDLDTFAPTATFIPEIWQGHKSNGEGFWIALNRLEVAGIVQ